MQSDDGTVRVRDARENNLDHVDVAVPRDRVVAFTDAGNTVVVVEHDMRVAARADWIVDLGPGGGGDGGRVVAAGRPHDVAASAGPTAACLAEAVAALQAG